LVVRSLLVCLTTYTVCLCLRFECRGCGSSVVVPCRSQNARPAVSSFSLQGVLKAIEREKVGLMSEKLNSATVRSRVRSGEYILCDKSNVRNSQVWTSFKSVCDRKNLYVGFAQGIKCGSVFVCKPGYGTSKTGHIETCRANSSLSGSQTKANEQSTSFGTGNQEDVLSESPSTSTESSPLPSPLNVVPSLNRHFITLPTL